MQKRRFFCLTNFLMKIFGWKIVKKTKWQIKIYQILKFQIKFFLVMFFLLSKLIFAKSAYFSFMRFIYWFEKRSSFILWNIYLSEGPYIFLLYHRFKWQVKQYKNVHCEMKRKLFKFFNIFKVFIRKFLSVLTKVQSLFLIMINATWHPKTMSLFKLAL